jgi:hypothetical protein
MQKRQVETSGMEVNKLRKRHRQKLELEISCYFVLRLVYFFYFFFITGYMKKLMPQC